MKNVTSSQRVWNNVLVGTASAIIVTSIASTAITATASSVVATAVATDATVSGAAAAATSASGSAAAAAAGTALVSLIKLMQGFHMFGKTSAFLHDAPAEAGNAALFASSLGWMNFHGEVPWSLDSPESAAADDAKNATARQLGGIGTGSDAANVGLSIVPGAEREFIGNFFWICLFLGIIVVVHVPTHCVAKMVVKRQKKNGRLMRVLRRRLKLRRDPAQKKREAVWGKLPVSRWETFEHTYPQLELAVFLLFYQGLAQSSAAAFADGSSSPATRIGAALLFAVVVLGGCLAVAWFVIVRLRRECRATLITDERGFHRWVDVDDGDSSRRVYTVRATRSPVIATTGMSS